VRFVGFGPRHGATGAVRRLWRRNNDGWAARVSSRCRHVLLRGSTSSHLRLLSRQTPPRKNDKSIIRDPTEVDPEAKAKLGNSNTADGVGDAPYFVPEPNRKRCRATVLGENWSYWFFIGHGQKRCAPREEALLSLVRTTRSRFQSRGDTATAESRESSMRKGRSAGQTRQTVNTGGHSTRQQPKRAMSRISWQTLSANE
jgi:hypothetical protein